MNNQILILLFPMLVASACTEIEHLNPSLPEIGKIELEAIQTSLPKINIRVDQTAFDEMYAGFEEEILVDAAISYYDVNREAILVDEKATIEIKGAGSAAFALKSIGITFDQAIDNVAHPILRPSKLLPGDHLDQLKTVRLRNSGNDFQGTMVKDIVYTDMAIAANLDLELMYFDKPVQVFVNEQYLGLLNIRSESNRDALAGLLQVPKEAITLFKVGIKNGNLEYKEGDESYGNRLEQVVKEEDSEALWDLIDIPNFIDYIIYQDYIGNTDWPHNNGRAYWIPGQKLRFFLFDLDLAASSRQKNAKIPELEFVSEDIAKIYRGLRNKDKEAFDARVMERQKELYQFFSPALFNETVDKFARVIENEMPYQIAKYDRPSSMLVWKLNLDLIKREFERRDHFIRRKYKLVN